MNGSGLPVKDKAAPMEIDKLIDRLVMPGSGPVIGECRGGLWVERREVAGLAGKYGRNQNRVKKRMIRINRLQSNQNIT